MWSSSYIILRIQRLEGKQWRSGWGGSLWATSPRSTLFAKIQLFSSLVLKEQIVLLYPGFESLRIVWFVLSSLAFLGPMVQSIVNSTKSLVKNSMSSSTRKIKCTYILAQKKMKEAFALQKLDTFFQQKNKKKKIEILCLIRLTFNPYVI